MNYSFPVNFLFIVVVVVHELDIDNVENINGMKEMIITINIEGATTRTKRNTEKILRR